MSESDPSDAGRRGSDILRQGVVAASAVVAVVGSFVGSGAVVGTPVSEAAGGALAADATRIAPGGPAFSIWTVIYLGLIGYAIWQLRPARRDDARQRALGYRAAVSMLLNVGWILSVQFDQLALSVVVIIGLLVVLASIFLTLLRIRPRTRTEAVLLDGTMGLYLGWVCVATAANVTAWLVARGFTGFGIDPDVWAVLVILVAGAVGVLLGIRGRGRLAPAAALCWGLAWVAVARLADAPASVPTAAAALAAVAAVLLVTVVARLRSGPNRSPVAG